MIFVQLFQLDSFNNESGEKKRKKNLKKIQEFFKEKNNQQCLKGEDDDQYDQEYSRVLMEGCLETNNTEAANRVSKREFVLLWLISLHQSF